MDQHDPNNMAQQSYQYYSQEQEPSYMPYGSPMTNYQVVQPHGGSQTHLQQQGMPPGYQMSMNQYQSPVYHPPSPPHVHLSLNASPPPPSPDMYDPLSPTISGSDTSADGIYHHSSSGANSPASSRGNSLVHRSGVRYNPTPSPTSSSGRRRGRSQDSEEEDMGANFAENLAHNRKEATRRQRIEAEQRRRDELRDGYAKLKEVLPISNQKSSKVNLLERATNHIVYLEQTNSDLQKRIAALEKELMRMQNVNAKIDITSSGGSTSMFNGRPPSPPPDLPLSNSLTSVKGPESHSAASTPSASGTSDGGY